MRVLFVDDDPNMHRLVELMFRDAPFESVNASSARVALHKLKNESFDCIISDLQMPEMDGLTFLEKLLLLNPDQKVIIMSAFGLKKLAETALASGAALVLEKPFQKKQLLQAIYSVINKVG